MAPLMLIITVSVYHPHVASIARGCRTDEGTAPSDHLNDVKTRERTDANKTPASHDLRMDEGRPEVMMLTSAVVGGR